MKRLLIAPYYLAVWIAALLAFGWSTWALATLLWFYWPGFLVVGALLGLVYASAGNAPKNAH
jgi:hypothetical protein